MVKLGLPEIAGSTSSGLLMRFIQVIAHDRW
jgi:hypothetical protein